MGYQNRNIIRQIPHDCHLYQSNLGGRTSSAGRHRPGSASGRSSVARQRPASGRNRPLSSRNRPMSSRNRVSSQNNIPERPGTSYKRPDSTMLGNMKIKRLSVFSDLFIRILVGGKFIPLFAGIQILQSFRLFL